MPLFKGIQLIVVADRHASGRLHCSTFDGLALPTPVLVQFAHTGSATARATMVRLEKALVNELATRARANSVEAPCKGLARVCHAVSEPDCQKVLVLVGDGISPASQSQVPPQWHMGGADFAILPVLPESARTQAATLMPGSLGALNVAFWGHAIEEVLPAVLQVAGITAAQPRIFISYRQSDRPHAAMQLFDALSHDNFDVFLDHFRVPPGVDFQARLRQELGDKSLVLVLESPNLASSRWVALEIAVAKACGLGLLAVNFDDAPQNPAIAPSLRVCLSRSDLASDGTLLPAALERVRAFVRREHDLALLRRRILLEQSFEQAVIGAGGSAQRQSDGSFRVNGGIKSYQAWLTSRPPELSDYHRAHGVAAPPVRGIMIGLSQLMEASRQDQQIWLAGLCGMVSVDEGLMVQAADDMMKGVL